MFFVNKISFLKQIEVLCFDNEEDKKEEDNKEEDKKEKEQLFTQEQVNSFLAAEKRKTQEADRKLMDQLKEMQKKVKMTDEEKKDLSSQIEELQAKYMTAEERQRQIEEKQTKKHQQEMEELLGERDVWKTRFVSSTIEVALTNAATKHEAANPEHVAAMLRPTARLSDILDENGKPTGKYEPRVKFRGLDKDDKPMDYDLTIDEAVKRMSEMPEHGNLFKNNKNGGLGAAGSQGRQGKIDLEHIAKTDPAKYRKLRKERPELWS